MFTERLLAPQDISQVEPSTSPISQNQPLLSISEDQSRPSTSQAILPSIRESLPSSLLSITQDQPLPSTSQAISPSVQESLPSASTSSGCERKATKRKFNDSVGKFLNHQNNN